MAHENDVTALPAPRSQPESQNAIERQGLDGQSIERKTTHAVVQADKAAALVQARIMQAIHRPRDFYRVREVVLKACERPRFAEKARYKKPTGKDKNGNQLFAVGLSIGFATEAFRAMGNLDISPMVVFEDARTRTIAVVGTDLETNASTSEEFTLTKTIERKFLKNGQIPIAKRRNSYDEDVFIVEATDDEFNVKAAAQLSKAWRNVVLKFVPSDLKEEALELIESTIAQGDKAIDPTAKRKKVIDYFTDKLGISTQQIAEYLGHGIDVATSEEIRELAGLQTAIFEGDVTWAELVESKRAPVASAGPDGVVPTNGRTKAAQEVADKLDKSKTKKREEKPAASPPPAAVTTTATATKEEKPAEKPKADPGVGFAEASTIIDNADAATTVEEVKTLREQLAGAVEAGRIGSTHATRCTVALDKAEARASGK